MDYKKTNLSDFEDMDLIISRNDLDIDSLEVYAYLGPGPGLYESILMLNLDDKDQSKEIKIANYDLNVLTTNNGSEYIGRPFSKEFLEQLIDFNNERLSK